MDVIGIALNMEQEAIDFYMTCAGKTRNPVGRKMFLSIVEDEKYHMACALQMQKGQKVNAERKASSEDMKKVFEQHKQDMLEGVPATADDLEALTVGMKMEEATVAFYKKAESQAATAEEKNFFDCLIKDEEEHFRIFQETHSFLSDSSNWYMRDEQGIVEG